MRGMAFGTALIAAMACPAFAAPITSNPGSLIANGNVTAVFAFADAEDASQLLGLNVGGAVFDFAESVGTSKSLGNNTGVIQFRLNNLAMGYSFGNDIADSDDAYYYARYGTTAADFGVTFSAETEAAIAALVGPVQLIGFEDRRGGDYDYNDLILAFSSALVAVPEPASFALLGLGLLGVGALRRGRPT